MVLAALAAVGGEARAACADDNLGEPNNTEATAAAVVDVGSQRDRDDAGPPGGSAF
jgi:hypothetical protein